MKAPVTGSEKSVDSARITTACATCTSARNALPRRSARLSMPRASCRVCTRTWGERHRLSRFTRFGVDAGPDAVLDGELCPRPAELGRQARRGQNPVSVRDQYLCLPRVFGERHTVLL